MLPDTIEEFIKIFSQLPGIGRKSSERIGFYLLKKPLEFSEKLAQTIIDLKLKTKECSICGNLSSTDPCYICSDANRNTKILCVVENAFDIYYIEATGIYNGLYHVLGGVISPLNGITPQDLKIKELIERVNSNNFEEIIFATSPTPEGDTTNLYIKELLKNRNILFTNLARGIPVGTNLQYAGNISLVQALKNREKI